jgi:hypothetical protein
MSKPFALAVFFSMTALFSEPAAVSAQATTPSPPGAPQAETPSPPGAPQAETPSLPGAPQAATPSLPGAPQATPNYRGCEISTAANDHGAFLWVVDNIQHVVTLCEKTDGDRDFNCTTKPLP